jgi:hypothetical protein
MALAIVPPLGSKGSRFYRKKNRLCTGGVLVPVTTKAFGYSFEHIYKMIPPNQPEIFAGQISARNVGSAHRYRCFEDL